MSNPEVFVGKEHLIRSLFTVKDSTEHSRYSKSVIWLYGPAGIGKTKLAIALAE